MLSYLRSKRKLKNETIAQFRLGAFPSLDILTGQFSEFELMLAGVARRDEDGRLTSKFCTNRLIVPIFDAHDRAVALMGRVICDEAERERLGAAKYDNTVYAKTKCLYGLNWAKAAIRESGAVLVVEGNFDVISAVQAGVKNVVASSGAFLSHSQVAQLSRYGERITVSLDADEAGQRAMDKIFGRPVTDGVILRRKEVPGGFKDWDEFFMKRSQ